MKTINYYFGNLRKTTAWSFNNYLFVFSTENDIFRPEIVFLD